MSAPGEMTLTFTLVPDGEGWYRAEAGGMWCAGPTPLAAVAGLCAQLDAAQRRETRGQMVQAAVPLMSIELKA